MSVGPRILFTRYQSADSPKLQPWIGHLGRVLRANGAAKDVEPKDQNSVRGSVEPKDQTSVRGSVEPKDQTSVPGSVEPKHQVGLPGSMEPEDEIDGVVVWQLVSANNRQLARGSRIHGNFGAAELHARAAVATASLLDIAFVSEQGRGDYGWIAAVAEEPVMVSSRWYLTERDCRHSIEISLRALVKAEVHRGARLSDPTLMGGARESHRN
ncbi:MAG: hypothetical protein ACSLE3_06270 [Microbacteriaceae bacterium]